MVCCSFSSSDLSSTGVGKMKMVKIQSRPSCFESQALCCVCRRFKFHSATVGLCCQAGVLLNGTRSFFPLRLSLSLALGLVSGLYRSSSTTTHFLHNLPLLQALSKREIVDQISKIIRGPKKLQKDPKWSKTASNHPQQQPSTGPSCLSRGLCNDDEHATRGFSLVRPKKAGRQLG